jgi:hypothetical protein
LHPTSLNQYPCQKIQTHGPHNQGCPIATRIGRMACLSKTLNCSLKERWKTPSRCKNLINCKEHDTLNVLKSSTQTSQFEVIKPSTHYCTLLADKLILSSSIIAKCLQKPFHKKGISQKRTALWTYATYRGNQCTDHKAGLSYNLKIRVWINRLCKVQVTDHGMVYGCRTSITQHIKTRINRGF